MTLILLPQQHKELSHNLNIFIFVFQRSVNVVRKMRVFVGLTRRLYIKNIFLKVPKRKKKCH
jgi:hypothetical protein